MLTRIFGQINSATSIFIGLLAASLAVSHFLFIQTPEFQISTAWGVFVFLPVVGYSIFAFGLIALLFGYQWLFEYKYKLVKRNAYFPFFLLIFVLIFSTNSGLDVLISLLFIGFVLASWFAVYQGEKLLGRTLNTGLVIGLGTLLDPKLSVMLLLSFVAYTVFGRFNGRAFLILIVGFLTVCVNSIALEYIFLGTNTVWSYYLELANLSSSQATLDISIYQLVLFPVLLFPAIPEFANTLSRATVFKRQAFTIFMVLVVVAAALLFIRGASVFYITMLIVSVLAIFVNYFQVMKRVWLQEIILWLMLGVLALFDLNIL